MGEDVCICSKGLGIAPEDPRGRGAAGCICGEGLDGRGERGRLTHFSRVLRGEGEGRKVKRSGTSTTTFMPDPRCQFGVPQFTLRVSREGGHSAGVLTVWFIAARTQVGVSCTSGHRWRRLLPATRTEHRHQGAPKPRCPGFSSGSISWACRASVSSSPAPGVQRTPHGPEPPSRVASRESLC